MNEEIRKNAEINEDSLENITGGGVEIVPVRNDTYRKCPKCGGRMKIGIFGSRGERCDRCDSCGLEIYG